MQVGHALLDRREERQASLDEAFGPILKVDLHQIDVVGAQVSVVVAEELGAAVARGIGDQARMVAPPQVRGLGLGQRRRRIHATRRALQ